MRALWYSLALDESSDVTDTAQLFIFIHGAYDDFDITQELLLMESLKDTTTGQNLPMKVSKKKHQEVWTSMGKIGKYHYSKRFGNFRKLESKLKILSNPFTVDGECAT